MRTTIFLACLATALVASADGSKAEELGAGSYERRVAKSRDSKREDFGTAKWLWPRELGAVRNTTVEFRRTFRAERAEELGLAIAADTVYAVELNGRFVHSGRFPDVPPQRYYDVLPLGICRPGENELKVQLYVQGINTFQTLPGDPGLMFAATGASVRVESGSGTEWRLSTRDRREGVPLVTGQLGFSFEYDAAKPEAAWRPVAAGDAVRTAQDCALERRPVPRVEILPEAPAKVVAQGRLDGSPVPESCAPGMDATRMSPVPAADFFDADGRSVRAANFADGFYVLVDLGRETAGFLSLDIDTDAGAVVDVGHAEHAENGRIRVEIDGRNFAGRYRAADGRQRYFRWARRMAGRYIQLHVRGVRTHFVLHGATVRPAELPLTELPPPKGLTALQRRIWETSVRTLRLCMHEHYEDCPWREQALYGNDARNQMLCGYHAFGPDNRMPELALQVHARGLRADGWLEMCMPAKIAITIPSFTLCWVLSVGDNLRYRGDPAFTRTLMPTVGRILDARLAEMREGLLPCPEGKRYWQFYEWARDLQGDLSGKTAVRPGELRFESALNLFLVLALESGAACAQATGDEAAAVRWRTAAQDLRGEIRRRFWNPDAGCMELSLTAKLHPSEFVQSLALLADAVPPEARGAVAKKLMKPSDWTQITLSQTLYKYEALLAAGGEAAASVVPAVDAEWARMLDQGATSFWEMREGWRAFRNAGSLCHGWSAVPIHIYSRTEGDGR